MRISENSLIQTMLNNLNRNRTQNARLLEQTSTAKSVNRPSDDSLAFSQSKDLEALLERNLQYQRNIDSGLEQARTIDPAISSILEKFYDIKRLATQAANNTYAQEDLNLIADNIAGAKQFIVDTLNTQVNDRFIFSGTRTQTQAFTLDSSGDVTYNGNNRALTVKMNETTSAQTSVTGEALQRYSAETIFDLLNRLEANMRSGNTAGVNADLDNITTATQHIAGQGTSLGNQIKQMEFAYEQYEVSNINLQSNVSRLVDTDFAEALGRLQTLQVAYEAALAVNGRLLRTSLLNFL